MNKKVIYSKIVAITFEEDEVDCRPYVHFGSSYGKWVKPIANGYWKFIYDDSVPPARTLQELCINYLVFWDPIANDKGGL